MIIIFSKGIETFLGGLEIFNQEFENLLKNRSINFYRVKNISNKTIIDYSYRIFSTIIHSWLKKPKFILVQYGNFFDTLSLPFLKLGLKKIKVIVHTNKTFKHLQNKFLLNLTRQIFKFFVDEVYIITEEQKEIFQHKNTTKISTIINNQYITQKKATSSEEKYILFLGRVCLEKGIEDLIKVYQKLLDTYDLPLLKIVGPVEKNYLKKLENIITSEKIKILSPVYNLTDKIKLIDLAEILVYPSYTDAFPLTVIESFARKTCCLATKIAETKYFIEFDEFLFLPGNLEELEYKLLNYLKNKEKYQNYLEIMQTKTLKYGNGTIIDEIFKKDSN